MKKQIGIWINKEKAVIISLEKEGCKVHTISSPLEGKMRFPGETKEFAGVGSHHGDIEKRKEKRLKIQTHEYLKNVVNNVKDADELALFGPAGMKKELEKLMHSDNMMASRLKGVENADNMSDNQMIAWVKNYYHK